jgi:ketosteroid isomerase-like protein
VSDSFFPQRQALPERVASQPAGSPAQQAFRQAMQAVENLRAQLQLLRASQAATRQAYWQQVGPVATATIAARRALYAPLELALTGGYLNRAEEQQVTDLLVHNARSLQERFGEDEAELLARYAPPLAPEELDEEAKPAAALEADPALLPHEQAAAQARARRQQQRQHARTTQALAAEVESQSLLQNTKAAYRQLARLHHPDRAAQADAATQQAQTAMMQRITAAYAAGDLAGLLALLATSDATTSPTSESEILLQRYTAALAQQRAQLTQQLETARRPVADAPWSGTEKQQRTRLREIKRSLRAETDYLSYLERQLHEPATLRQVLRELAASGQAGI